MFGGECEARLHVALYVAEGAALVLRAAPAGTPLLFHNTHRFIFVNRRFINLRALWWWHETVLPCKSDALGTIRGVGADCAAFRTAASAGARLARERARLCGLVAGHETVRLGKRNARLK